jgi:hypothetical protein
MPRHDLVKKADKSTVYLRPLPAVTFDLVTYDLSNFPRLT